MLEKLRKLGVGEILLAIVFILGIIGMIAFFFLGDDLGENKTNLIIWSSLAFIGSFFILSVYARLIKRKHGGQLQYKKALGNWMAHYSPDEGLTSSSMPQGTVEALALHLYRTDGFQVANGSKPEQGGVYILVSQDGQREMIQCFQQELPVGLREVVRFYEVLRAEKASRGEMWSLSGFTEEAAHWAAKKPIVLVGAEQVNEMAKGLFASAI